MTSKEILKALLSRNLTSAEAMRLQQECEPARQAIRTRLEQISAPVTALRRTFTLDPNTRDPDAQHEALLASPEAVIALRREAETLHAELEYVDRLEFLCAKKHEELLTAETRVAIPIAVRQLPRAIDKVRAAITALDSAIAGLGEEVAVIANYRRLESQQLPLNDAQLSALFEVRETLWAPRVLPTLFPPSLQSHPRAWALCYEQTYRAGNIAIRQRKGPHTPQEDYKWDPATRGAHEENFV